jgi:hypothetical protein
MFGVAQDKSQDEGGGAKTRWRVLFLWGDQFMPQERTGLSGPLRAPSAIAKYSARVALLMAGTLFMMGLEPASPKPLVRLAQQAQAHLGVPSTIIAAPGSEVSIAIEIGPADALPAQSFIRMRGLPQNVSLSEGHSIGPGYWAISLASLSSLKANVPSATSGTFEIIIMLVSLDGTVLAEARSTLVVGSVAQMIVPAESPTLKETSPLAPPMPVPVGRADHNTQIAPRPPVLSSEERERALSYLKKGDEQLAEGNIAAARLFYIRAANAGLAQGAMALASTYDAMELGRLNVRGVEPDAKEAMRWYERARQLGAADADQRLKRLSAH